MRAAIIVDGRVDNIIEVEHLDVLEGVMLVEAQTASIGDRWDGENFIQPAPEPTTPAIPDYVAEVQRLLDTKAQERLYDSILSACTYVTSANPKFQAEGQSCVAWRDSVWATCYDLMGQVQSGQLPQPTVSELLAMLPTMEWRE